MSIIIGIDPGTFHTGYAIIQNGNPLDWGVLRPNSKIDIYQRIHILGCSFKTLLQTYVSTDNDIILAIECAFMGAYARSVIGLSQLRGVFIFLAMELAIPIEEFTACQVKSLFTGKGSSNKLAMMKAVSKHFEIDPDNLTSDCADALAIAYCSYRNRKIKT